MFHSKETLVDFLTILEPPLQCDALLWSYSLSDRVILAMDENCCVNHRSEADGGRNIGYEQDGSYFALIDVKKGDEVVDDYDNYGIQQSRMVRRHSKTSVGKSRGTATGKERQRRSQQSRGSGVVPATRCWPVSNA